MLNFSVVIITLNAESYLKDCLESVKDLTSEIIIVDSGSTDQTKTIAESYSQVKFYTQQWLGFGKQKQYAVSLASRDWVLCLDADEVLSTELRQNLIIQFSDIEKDIHKVYELCRCNYFLGQFLRHGEGYPDWCLRLFNRKVANWSNDDVHEKVIYNEESIEKLRLNGDFLHFSAENLSNYVAKQNRYSSIQAQTIFQAQPNLSVNIMKLILSPCLRFIKFYFLKKGFKDGKAGLIHISIGCITSFLKYIKLIELQINHKQDNKF